MEFVLGEKVRIVANKIPETGINVTEQFPDRIGIYIEHCTPDIVMLENEDGDMWEFFANEIEPLSDAGCQSIWDQEW